MQLELFNLSPMRVYRWQKNCNFRLKDDRKPDTEFSFVFGLMLRPIIAGVAMSLSSVSVINQQRLAAGGQ